MCVCVCRCGCVGHSIPRIVTSYLSFVVIGLRRVREERLADLHLANPGKNKFRYPPLRVCVYMFVCVCK